MKYLPQLFANNRAWAAKIKAQDPDFFGRLVSIQSPEYLWIGCSDSRVPANQITGLEPGEVYVHRNVANIVVADDINCLSVIQFAVDVLKIRHIIVCGHYGCGGVKSALLDESLGIVDQWLDHIRKIKQIHSTTMDALPNLEQRWDYLCELNVIEQVKNVCETATVRKAWERGQELVVHGWIYGLKNGLLRDLEVSLNRPEQCESALERAISHLRQQPD